MSIKLSDLINNVIGDVHSEPKEIEMQTIANAVERVMGADVILRKQIEQRMRNYARKLVTDGQMLNCLILTNFLVQNSSTFRTQVAEFSFVQLLQQIGKMTKRYDECNDVEYKVRELISIWGKFYPGELSEYATMLKKFSERNVIDPSSQPITYLPSPIFSLVLHVEHNLRNISRAMETKSGDLESIYNYAQKISTKFNAECQKCRENIDRYDSDELEVYEKLGKRLSDNLVNLKNMIDGKHVTKIHTLQPIMIKQHIPTPQENRDNIIKARGRKTPNLAMQSTSLSVHMKQKPKPENCFMSHSFMLTRGETAEEGDINDDGSSDSSDSEDGILHPKDDRMEIVKIVRKMKKTDETIHPSDRNPFKFNLKFPTQSTHNMESQPDVFSFDDEQ